MNMTLALIRGMYVNMDETVGSRCEYELSGAERGMCACRSCGKEEAGEGSEKRPGDRVERTRKREREVEGDGTREREGTIEGGRRGTETNVRERVCMCV